MNYKNILTKDFFEIQFIVTLAFSFHLTAELILFAHFVAELE